MLTIATALPFKWAQRSSGISQVTQLVKSPAAWQPVCISGCTSRGVETPVARHLAGAPSTLADCCTNECSSKAWGPGRELLTLLWGLGVKMSRMTPEWGSRGRVAILFCLEAKSPEGRWMEGRAAPTEGKACAKAWQGQGTAMRKEGQRKETGRAAQV